MYLSAIEFEGYRGYRELTRIDFAPLTLLYGDNSAGKSSILRLLPILKTSSRSASGASPLMLDSAINKSATVSDIFCKLSNSQTMVFNLQFLPNEHSYYKAGPVDIKYTLRVLDGIPVVFDFEVKTLERSRRLELSLVDKSSLQPDRRQYIDRSADGELISVRFSGLKPIFRDSKARSSWSENISILRECLFALEDTEWLGPVRKSIPRVEIVNDAVFQVGHDGGNAAQVLYRDFSADRDIFTIVDSWFRKYCGVNLEVVRGAHEFGAIASLALTRKGDATVRVPLEDAGEGMTQVLAVLTIAAMAKLGRFGYSPIIAIEHPDLHLHSNAHYGVVEYLVDCTRSKYTPRFIIESHSEAVLTAAQLEILKGSMNAKDYLVHYVSSNDAGASTINTVALNDKAMPVDETVGNPDWFSTVHGKALELAKMRILGH